MVSADQGGKEESTDGYSLKVSYHFLSLTVSALHNSVTTKYREDVSGIHLKQ